MWWVEHRCILSLHAAGLYEAFEDGRIDQPHLQQVFASYVAALSMGRRLVLRIESNNSIVRPAFPPGWGSKPCVSPSTLSSGQKRTTPAQKATEVGLIAWLSQFSCSLPKPLPAFGWGSFSLNIKL